MVDQNLATGHLSATFFIDAEGATEAVEKGAIAWAEALVEAGLPLTQVVAVRASLVTADAEESERELVPAGA